MQYEHTQKGYLHWLVYFGGVACLVTAWLAQDSPVAIAVLLAVGACVFLIGMAFHTMTVRDEGDSLAIYYGPLPLFRARIRYADLTSAEPDRSSIIDGWGIHYVPGRGLTYNLWGFDCVKLQVGSRVVRVGTDDVENLVRFLRSRIPGRR